MKKILLSLVVLTGIYSAASAQTKNTNEIGFNVGYNASQVSSSQYGTSMSTDYTGGINVGFSAEHFFSDRWGIKGKIIYDQKGWGNGYLYNDDTDSEVDGVNFHVNYLTIPVMANWHFGKTRNWYLNFGPYVGFLLNASESSNSGYDIKPAFNSTDFGLAFGIGVKIPLSDKVKLFLEYDGQGGLTNMSKGNDGTLQNVRSAFNIGLAFPVK